MLSEFWSDLRYRVRALARRDDLERELEEELRFHLEREAEKLEGQGVPSHEARRRARLAFGGVERAKEESRDARGTVLLEMFLQDLRYAARGLRARPAFTVGVVITLALGIGANVAMFGMVDRLLFRPPAFLRDAEHTHRVYDTWLERGTDRTERHVAFARYIDYARLTRSFTSVAAFATRDIAVGDGEATRERRITAASASYFDLFDVRPALGRFYTAREDGAPDGAPVAVLGYAFWQAEYGGRAEAVGSTLRIGKTLYTIIGVAPDGFAGLADQGVPSLYIPLTAYAWYLRGRDYSRTYQWSWIELAVRRRADVSVAAADADLTSAFRRSALVEAAEAGETSALVDASHPRASLGPLALGRGLQAGPEAKVVAWTGGVALIVLLIACANVAGLLLSRAVTRRREIALRLALGVGRRRLVGQLLTESLLLAVLGGIAGLAVAHWLSALVRTLLLGDEASPTPFTDARTLGIALAATLAAALLTGLAPMAQAVRSDLSHVLNGGGRDAGAAVHSSRTRTALLVLQATLSVVLLVGAGLFVRSLHNVRTMRLGYDVAPVLVVSENPRGVKLTRTELIALENRLVDEARAMPEVESATPAATIPFWSNEGRGLWVPGVDSVESLGRFLLQAGGPEYFRTVGTRILRGRAFDASDRATSPPVVVVSEGMARAIWPGQDPLGKCIRISADTMPCSAVIGVAEEMRVRSLSEAREYAYYIPAAQYGDATGMLFVRVRGDAADAVDVVRRRLQRLMPGPAYVNAQPFRNMVDRTTVSWQIGARMFTMFGALALVLAGVGLYSMIAYAVAQRRREIGVRIALGASRAQVVRLVVRGGMGFVLAGIAIGSVLSIAAGRWLGALLFRVSPNDPAVYAAVAAALVAVALVATALPARMASRVDPNEVLRGE